ncbi:hypothetical protein MMC12_008260 [Toensbergia leucococca]|nr:hypothetical protein [Toensbergia leucococca]
MDAFTGTTMQATRESPLRIFLRDVGVLITMLRYVPWIFLPLKAPKSRKELALSASNTRDVILQSWLFVMEMVILLLAIPAILLLPGSLTMCLAVMCCVCIKIVSLPMQGSRIVYSNMDAATILMTKQHEDERWLFVNGILAGHSGLQKNIDRLSQTFGRPVIGIHNQSYGFLADLLECLIQRCLSFNTMDVRVTYEHVKACLSDPSITKVVLISHSQGSIIASMVLDHLFANLPPSIISKLEIYTFGSAACHFNNPLLTLPPNPTPCIPHIEHYCNEHDLIPRWGLLYNIRSILNNRYSGSVFVRLGASGHLFCQHYMDPIFPLPPPITSNPNDHSTQQTSTTSTTPSFLDQTVDVDEKTAAERQSTAFARMGLMRQEESSSKIMFGDGMAVPVGLLQMDGGIGDEERERVCFVESLGRGGGAVGARGKTVRQLSRLWRYLGGRSPGEEGVVNEAGAEL